MIFLSLITWIFSYSCWCLAEENSGGFKPTLFSCSGRKARRKGELYGRGQCLTWLMRGRHCTTLPAIWLNWAFKNRVLRNTRTPSVFFWQDRKTQRTFSCTCKSFHNTAEKDAIKKTCVIISSGMYYGLQDKFFFFFFAGDKLSIKFYNEDLWQALLEFWLLF